MLNQIDTVVCHCLHQKGLNTRSMTWRSVTVGVEGEGGRARAETQTMLNYAGYHRAPEDSPAEAGNISASNLSLICIDTVV